MLAVLKLALWNVLWVEVAPMPGLPKTCIIILLMHSVWKPFDSSQTAGGWPPRAAALRSRLKDAAGRLMGQLFDRNCRRAFAPVEAFHADALPADRFQAEIRVRRRRQVDAILISLRTVVCCEPSSCRRAQVREGS